MKVLTITSGKGGVGKTTLAMNAARQLSLHGLRTLIIDFDIHNKGSTSLFMDKLSASSPSVVSIVGASNGFRADLATELAERTAPVALDRDEKLFLIPASRPREKLDWSRFVGHNDDIVRFFRLFIEEIATRQNFDVVLIDCYGGIDSLTVSAAGIADDTIVVNEPDVVTFSGTLLLYSYIDDTYTDSEFTPRIHFVINRITSRHSFFFLNREYQKHLSELAITKSILAYIPYDELVVRTFGDYPFFTELLPRSLITKKIRLMLRNLWKEESFRKIMDLNVRQERKIYQATSEAAFADPARIIRLAVSAPIWLIMPTSVLLVLFFGVGSEELGYNTIRMAFYCSLLLIGLIVLFVGGFLPIQISRWLFRGARYRLRRAMLGPRGHLRSWTGVLAFPHTILPAVFGLMFMGGMTVLAYQTQEDWLPLRNVSIWPNAVVGFKAGGDYAGLQVRDSTAILSRDLRNADFSGARLVGARLQEAQLEGANFSGADLSRANLAASSLDSATMRYATLRFTDFSGASLRRVDFTGARIRNVNLRDADLIGARFAESDLSFQGFLPSELDQVDLSGLNLEDGEFSGSRLVDADLSRANLQGAYLVGADLTGVNADHASFARSHLKGATFRDATLLHADLSGSDLSFVNFAGAHLDSVRLADARLYETRLSRSRGLSAQNLSYARAGGAELSEEQNREADDWEDENPTRRFNRGAFGSGDPIILDQRVDATKERLQRFPLGDRHNSVAENLVEYLVIRNESGDLAEAMKLLEGLGRPAVMEDSGHGEGVYRLLTLLVSVVSEADDLEAGREWIGLVRRDADPGLENWNWSAWERWFPAHRYSREQNRKLRFIQLTAEGRGSPDILDEWYPM